MSEPALAAAERSVGSAADLPTTVEVVSEEASFLRLEPLWNRLVEAADTVNPFVTFPWVRTWWEAFGAGKRLHILVVRAGDEVIGIAPLVQTTNRIYGFKLRCLEFPANVHTPRFDVIVGRRPLEVYRAIWSHLLAERDVWDVLLLRQMSEGSATLAQLSLLAETSRFPVGCWRSVDSPYLPIRDEWEGYLKRIKPKHRQNLRNRLRRLSTIGPVTLEEVFSADEVATALEDGLNLEGSGWKHDDGTSIRSQPAASLFYKRLAERLSQSGLLRLYFLKVGGQRIAFHYSILHGNRMFLLKPGYDPSHAQYSPANLLCYLFLEHAFRSGLQEFDFLGATEEWKLEWTQSCRPHYWLFIFSAGLRSSFLHFVKFKLLPAWQPSKSYRTIRSAVTAIRRRFGYAERGW